MRLDKPTILVSVASLFYAIKKTIQQIVDPFDTDEFRRNCPAPPGCSHRLHCCRRGSLPPKFECGIWTHDAEVSPQLRELVEMGLNDCDVLNWPREAIAPKDRELSALWDPLPPPGYSPFELINKLKRPADVDPITFMIEELRKMTLTERYYMVEYIGGREVRKWLESDEFTARKTLVPKYSVDEILEFLNVIDGTITLRYIQRLYEIEYVRRFRPYETSFLVSQLKRGLKPFRYGSPAYIYLRTQCPARLPDVPKLRVHPKTTYSRIFEFKETHPLNHIYVAFGRTPHHLYCCPMQITLLDFAVLLSALTPVGRQCVCEFYNKHGRIPSVLYWTWVTGAKCSQTGFEAHKVSPFGRARTLDCFAASIPMNRAQVRNVSCIVGCGSNIAMQGNLRLDDFHHPFEWVFPNLLETCTTLLFTHSEWSATGPNYTSYRIERGPVSGTYSPTTGQNDVTTCGMLGSNWTSLVSCDNQVYYRVSRDGVVRDIPLTRYPTHADLNSEELRQAVEQAFAPGASATSNAVEGESLLSNPALSSVGPARD